MFIWWKQFSKQKRCSILLVHRTHEIMQEKKMQFHSQQTSEMDCKHQEGTDRIQGWDSTTRNH